VIATQEIQLSELHNRVLEIDVSEHGSVVYHLIDGRLTALPEEWDRPRWNSETWRRGSWTTVLGLPGVKAWGAYKGNQLVGFAVYRPNLTDTMAQLAALFVSKDQRRQGIAARLVEVASHQARTDGHTQLYVSATPSQSAVNFYQHQGFVPAPEANQELFELEPEDIHMVKQL